VKEAIKTHATYSSYPILTVDYPAMVKSKLHMNSNILIDDGNFGATVISFSEDRMYCIMRANNEGKVVCIGRDSKPL